jgi:hypothetical protein
MNYDDWSRLSDSEKAAVQAGWNAYAPGYWHELAQEAAERFRAEFGQTPHVVNVGHGLYHGGQLIIGVWTDLTYPHKAALPEQYAGFAVRQFCAA